MIIKPNEVKLLPVKYLATPALISESGGKIVVSYSDLSSSENLQAIFFCRLLQPEKVIATSVSPVVYINNIEDVVTFKVKYINKTYGRVAMLIKVNAYPQGLQIATPATSLVLAGGEERIVTYQAKIMDVMSQYSPDFNVTVGCFDPSGANLASCTVHITQLGSSRRMAPDNLQAYNQVINTTTVSYTRLNKANSYYTLSTAGNEALTPDSKVAYSLNLDYYDKLKATDVYDSWVNYSNKDFSIRAGSIMDNLDYSMFGRGLKASLNLDGHSSIDFYTMQSSYVLYSEIFNQVPQGAIIASSYNFNYRYTGKISLLYSYNPLTHTYTGFTNGVMQIPLNNNQHLQIRAGFSNETLKDDDAGKRGIAGGFIYDYQTSRWNLNLNNYYSSAYYSGLERGITQLDEHLKFTLSPKVSLIGHYAYLSNAPRYLMDTLNTNGWYDNTSTVEAGVNYNNHWLNVFVHPYWFNQKLNAPGGLFPADPVARIGSRSARLGVDINYGFPRGQQLNVLSDWGYTYSNNPYLASKAYTGLKLTANLSSGWWGISSLVQTAPYYISEEANAVTGQQHYHIYAFGPSAHLNTLKNKLDVTVNDYVNFTGFTIKRTNILNAQCLYKLKGGWMASAQVFYSNYQYAGSINNLQTRAGISKQFTGDNQPGLHKLELKFFNDANNNGELDNGESLINGVVIGLISKDQSYNSSLTTVSDNKGITGYSNLKEGNYAVFIIQSHGWYLEGPTSIYLTKNQKLTVPLVKAGWLKGKLNLVKQLYISTKPVLEGIRIVATDNQKHTFSTLTNENGEFELPLPVNSYRITAEIDSHKMSLITPEVLVTVKQDNNGPVTFDVQDESRKVIVKEF